jgi:hypothetical protein
MVDPPRELLIRGSQVRLLPGAPTKDRAPSGSFRGRAGGRCPSQECLRWLGRMDVDRFPCPLCPGDLTATVIAHTKDCIYFVNRRAARKPPRKLTGLSHRCGPRDEARPRISQTPRRAAQQTTFSVARRKGSSHLWPLRSAVCHPHSRGRRGERAGSALRGVPETTATA